MNTAVDVIGGKVRWSAECADCLAWLRSLPDDSVDLLFTSPPYEAARTYSIGFAKSGQDWVDWMVEVVRAAAPKVKGLIAVNCEGQTRDYSYSGVPFLLFADLKRAGFNLRKPPVFRRVGIPGSGGPDWLRNDYEPVVCVTRPGKLPWSDNTACGHPPKWAPGGEMSNRLADGQRVNQWGMRIRKDGLLTATDPTPGDGLVARATKPSHRVVEVGEQDAVPQLFDGGEPVESLPVVNAFGVSTTTTRRRTGSGKVEPLRRIDLIEFLSRYGMPLGALQPVGLLTYGLQSGESLPGETRAPDAFAFGAAVAAGPVAAAVVGDADGVTLALTACRTILAAQSWVRVALVLSEDAVVDHDDLPPGRTYRRPVDWQAVLAFVSGLDAGRAV